MKDRVKFVKNIRIIKEKAEPDLLAIKATGITELKQLLAPVLVSAKKYKSPPADGIYEFNFVLGTTEDEFTDVEMEVDVVFRFKNIPKWVKGIKVNAKENSDIELL
ncbi:MAG: hypothetical protein K8R37_15160 [Bacteroidales bacterium]|nr:hypothetical protein [Bacteroidales bacterium]